MVEDLDRDNAAEAEEAGGGSGLRKRRGSGVSFRGQAGQKTVPDDLRELLVCWKPESGA